MPDIDGCNGCIHADEDHCPGVEPRVNAEQGCSAKITCAVRCACGHYGFEHGIDPDDPSQVTRCFAGGCVCGSGVCLYGAAICTHAQCQGWRP